MPAVPPHPTENGISLCKLGLLQKITSEIITARGKMIGSAQAAIAGGQGRAETGLTTTGLARGSSLPCPGLGAGA